MREEGHWLLLSSVLPAAAAMYVCDVAEAVSTSRRALRGAKIPESEFTTLPNGLNWMLSYWPSKQSPFGTPVKVIEG